MAEQNFVFLVAGLKNEICILGMCSPLYPRFMGSNPAEVSGFLRAMKICSRTYFRRE
jgi:hypothetical protein